jgi:uncharacterized membrane protein YgcG
MTRLAHIYKSGLAALLAVFALHQPARATERILSFDSTVTVGRDGTLTVREVIRVRAEGQDIKRGIYRDFPTVYQDDKGRTIVVGFAFDSARRDGQPETWRVENHQNGVRIYLGSKSVMLPRGEHSYELNYRTDRQTGFFADHDEIYWNATGNGWGFRIDQATATVRLPEDIPRDQIRYEAYTGGQGSKARDYQAELRDGAPYYRTTRPLGAREGLTIVASWPKGYINAPVENPAPLAGATQRPGYDSARDAAQAASRHGWSPLEGLLGRRVAHDNGAFWYTLLGFLVLVTYYYFIWDRVGRDPPGRVVIPEYQPPADQSPASMRYIMRMSYDNECFGAAVLSLAVKGFLRIEEDAGILGFGKTFTLVKQPTPEKQVLTADEQVLFNGLFVGHDWLVLKQENHRVVGGARSKHSACLKNLYSAGFFSINGGWHFLGIVISLLVVGVAFVFPGNTDQWPTWHLGTPLGWATIALALAGIIANGVFGWLLKAPTQKGQAAMDHIRGFKMYLEVAEGEDLKRVAAPPLTRQLFEAYLPAALALDVEQKWSERFARELDIQAPDYQPGWYSGPGFSARNLAAFSSSLGSSLNSAIASSSTAPGSKSGGGGRGSSGGGGGGGGGGGW